MVSRRTILKGVAVAAAVPVIVSNALAAGKTVTSGLTSANSIDVALLPRKKIKLVKPPHAHEHEQVARSGPKVIEFEMTITEQEVEIDDDGTMLQSMTFDGSIPGPLMIVHEGDYVELTLINPAENNFSHNIDFHASTGAMGGGSLTLIEPGEMTILRFKATRPGTFIYHCAPGGAMIPWHVVSGMSGALMVLPRDGLKTDTGAPISYDKIFYIGESDFYIPKDENGDYKRFKDHADAFDETISLMNGLIPTHLTFNGRVGALTGENALKAKVGERVLFIHFQANRDTRPHLIGGHGDYVWETGKFNNPPERDLETWFIRGGSAGSALYTFLQPGIYAYLNHNLIEAINLGAVAHVSVEGDWDNDLMEQVVAPTSIAG